MRWRVEGGRAAGGRVRARSAEAHKPLFRKAGRVRSAAGIALNAVWVFHGRRSFPAVSPRVCRVAVAIENCCAGDGDLASSAT